MYDVLLNTEDVSKILHVGKSTVKRWAEEGKLKCFRTPGGHRKFKQESIKEFIAVYGYDVSLSFSVNAPSDQFVAAA